jgi:hypothetical protein
MFLFLVTRYSISWIKLINLNITSLLMLLEFRNGLFIKLVDMSCLM